MDSNRRREERGACSVCLYHQPPKWDRLLGNLVLSFHPQGPVPKVLAGNHWNLLSFLLFREGRRSRLTNWPSDRGDRRIIVEWRELDLDQVSRCSSKGILHFMCQDTGMREPALLVGTEGELWGTRTVAQYGAWHLLEMTVSSLGSSLNALPGEVPNL